MSESLAQSAGLELLAADPVADLDVDALLLPVGNALVDDVEGLVGGIVHHLDFEPIGRVIESADRIDCPADNVDLVENRDLHGDDGQFRVGETSTRDTLLAKVAQSHEGQERAVEREKHEHDEKEDVGCNDQRSHESVFQVGLLEWSCAVGDLDFFRRTPISRSRLRARSTAL